LRKIHRRDFIIKGTAGVIIAVIGVSGPIFLKTKQIEAEESEEKNKERVIWGFFIDSEKCIGCGLCAKACKIENEVPLEPEYNRTWIERYIVGKNKEILVDSPNGGIDGFPELNYKENIEKSFFVPKLCNQCDNSPCIQVCPVGAHYMTDDGVIIIDKDRCIGCSYCIQACPYGARYLHPSEHTADKCNLCYHRISQDLNPSCVEVCPVEARIFGDLEDQNSEIRDLLKIERTNVLKPHLGTKPKVFYKGIQEGVR